MATFHLDMNIGYSGSTIPHFQYITREGKYEKKNEDLILKKTMNLPDWHLRKWTFGKPLITTIIEVIEK